MVDVVVVRPDPQPIAVGEPGFVPLGVAAPQGLGAIASPGIAPASSHEDHVHPVTNLLSAATPAAILTGGTVGSAGVSGVLSRDDHSHPIVAVPTLAGANIFQPSSASSVPVIIRAAAAQGVSLQEWQSSASVAQMSVTLDGDLAFGAGSAAVGAIRLPNANGTGGINAASIYWRNAANSADVRGVVLNSSDQLSLAAGGMIVSQAGSTSIGTSINTDYLLNVFSAVAHPGTNVSAFGVLSDAIYPAAATTAVYSMYSRLRTNASAYTVTSAHAYFAAVPIIGAGSSIANAYGMRIANQGSASVTSAYGLLIESQTGAVTNNLPLVVTSLSTFSVQNTGQLTIGGTATSALIGLSSAVHPNTAVNVIGIDVQYVVPTTATTTAYMIKSFPRLQAGGVFSTIASYRVDTPVPGTATVASMNGIMVTNQGFANATNAYGIFIFPQSGASGDNLPLVIGNANTFSVNSSGQVTMGAASAPTRLFYAGTAAHPNAGVSIYGVHVEPTVPATATSLYAAYTATLRTAASAFTLTNAYGFQVEPTTTLGAGSAVTNAYGFYSSNVGKAGITNSYGFYGTSQSGSATLNVTARFDTGTTAAVWIGGNTSATDVTGGIAFGSARDTTLYRSGAGILNINSTQSFGTENSGAFQSMTKQIAAAANPGANVGKLYFRDGTNASTLKLVVKAGATGTETTILDNIST